MDRKQGTKKKMIIAYKITKELLYINICSFPPIPQRVQICTNAKSVLYGIIGIEYCKIPLNSGYVTDPM